jgi:hypothetical protein
MDDKSKCKISECCQKHWYRILGIVLVVLAAILTIVTFSGLGILGMFLAGLMLCCHKHLSSKMGCGCDCPCCSPEGMCGTGEKDKVVSERKTASKK